MGVDILAIPMTLAIGFCNSLYASTGCWFKLLQEVQAYANIAGAVSHCTTCITDIGDYVSYRVLAKLTTYR